MPDRNYMLHDFLRLGIFHIYASIIPSSSADCSNWQNSKHPQSLAFYTAVEGHNFSVLSRTGSMCKAHKPSFYSCNLRWVLRTVMSCVGTFGRW